LPTFDIRGGPLTFSTYGIQCGMGDYLMGIEGFFGILPRAVAEAGNLPAFGSEGGQFARFWRRGWAMLRPHQILRAGRNQSKYYQGPPQNPNQGALGAEGRRPIASSPLIWILRGALA
jgi:hypothetical protein